MTDQPGSLYQAVGLDVPRLTRTDVAAIAGSDPDRTRRWWRALGFPEVPDDVVAFGDQDVEIVRRLLALTDAGLATDDNVLRLARLLGSSFTRICDAQVATLSELVGDLSDPEAAWADSPVADLFQDTLLYVWRRHLLAALGRAVNDAGHHDGVEIDQAVGFADLSGFTRLTQRTTPERLTELVDLFEQVAFDVVSGAGGRAVKLIGDEVMWTSPDAAAAVDIAATLMRRLAPVPDMPELHVGVAAGPTIALGGDVFGPAVNLAARLTTVARRGTIVVARDTFDAAGLDDPALDALHVRKVRRGYDLKGIGVVRIVVLRPRDLELSEPSEASALAGGAGPAGVDSVG